MYEAYRDEAALTDSGWPTTPLEARTEGGAFAQTTISNDTLVLYDFDFSAVPDGIAVAGIAVRVDAKKTDSGGTSNLRIGVELSWNGGSSWTSALTTALLSATEASFVVGGPDEDWGRAWTRDEIVDDLRVRITAASDSISGTPTWHVSLARPTVYCYRETGAAEKVLETVEIGERVVVNPTTLRFYERISVFDGGSGAGGGKVTPRVAQHLRLAGTALSALESSADFDATATRPQHREGLGCRLVSEAHGLDLFIGDATLLTQTSSIGYPGYIFQPGLLDLSDCSAEADLGGVLAATVCEIRIANREYVNQFAGASAIPRSLSYLSNFRPLVGATLTVWSYANSGDGWKKLVIFDGQVEDIDFDESSVQVRAVDGGSGTLPVPDIFVDETLFYYDGVEGEEVKGNRGKPVPIGIGRFDYGAIKKPGDFSATHPFAISYDPASGDRKTYTNIALFPAMFGLKHPMMPTIHAISGWPGQNVAIDTGAKRNVFLYGSRKSSPALGVFTGSSVESSQRGKRAQSFPGVDTSVVRGSPNDSDYLLLWTWHQDGEREFGLPFVKAERDDWARILSGDPVNNLEHRKIGAGFMEWVNGQWSAGNAMDAYGVFVDRSFERAVNYEKPPAIYPGPMQTVAIPMLGLTKVGKRTRVTNIIPIFRSPSFDTSPKSGTGIGYVQNPENCQNLEKIEAYTRVNNAAYLSLQCPLDGPSLGKIRGVRVCMLWDSASTAHNVYMLARLGPSQNYAVMQAVYGTSSYNRDFGATLNETDIVDPDTSYGVPVMKLDGPLTDTPFASMYLLPYWDDSLFNTDASIAPPWRVFRSRAANVLFDDSRKSQEINFVDRDFYVWRRGRSEWQFTSMDTSAEGAFDWLEWPWDFMVHVRDLSGGTPIAGRYIDIYAIWLEVIFDSSLKAKSPESLVAKREAVKQLQSRQPGAWKWAQTLVGRQTKEVDFPAVDFTFQRKGAKTGGASPVFVSGRGLIDDASGSLTGTAYKIVENPADVAQALIRHYGGDAVYAARATGSTFGSFSTARTLLGTHRMTLVVDTAETLASVAQRIASQSMSSIVESIDITGKRSWMMFVETDDPATEDPNRMYRADDFAFSLNHFAGGTFKAIVTPLQELASGVVLAYGLHLPSGEWLDEKYITPSSSNLDTEAPTYIAAMQTTLRDYRVTSRIRVEAPDIWDPSCAERLCKWHANRVRRKRVTVEFETFANGLDLKPGHVIRIDDDVQEKVYYPGDGLSWSGSSFNVTQVASRKDAGQMTRVFVRASEIVVTP